MVGHLTFEAAVASGVVYGAYYLFITTVCILRRHRRYLAARSPPLMILMQTCGLVAFLLVTHVLYEGRNPQTCLEISLFISFYTPLWAFPYILQILVVTVEANRKKLGTMFFKAKRLARWKHGLAVTASNNSSGTSVDINSSNASANQLTPPAATTAAGPGEVSETGSEKGDSMDMNASVKDLPWQLRTRGWFTLKFKLLAIAIFLVLQLILTFCLTFLLPVAEGEDCLTPALYSFSAFGFLLIAIVVGFAFRIFKLKDPFYMKYEMVMNSLIFSPLMIFSCVVAYGGDIFPENFDILWIFLCASVCGILINLTFPVLLSFDSVLNFLAQRTPSRFEIAEFELDDLFSNQAMLANLSKADKLMMCIFEIPSLLEAFTAYAQKNWSVENVFFFQEATMYRNAHPKEFPERAKSIIDSYIKRHAPLEINIDSQLRANIFQKFKDNRSDPELFKEAEEHVFKVMRDDTLLSWQSTTSFKTAIVKAIEERSKGRSKQAATLRMKVEDRPAIDTKRDDDKITEVHELV